jgi:metallo-beta-lactamase family protein
MKITFLGAAKSVTGSCHMVEAGGLTVLVDCGMRQGRDAKGELGAGQLSFDAGAIDFVLLTHAHIDHSGLLPMLVKRGFSGRILTTGATAELVEIMLIDSGHIQELEAEWKSRKNTRAGRPPEEPLYTAEDGKAVQAYITPLEYDSFYDLNDKVRVRFVDAGHLFGSACVEFYENADGKTIKTVFSGDLGHEGIPLLNDPDVIDSADYVVMESTYGDRLHEDTRPPKEQLKDILTQAIRRGGNIVIPSFAVGRTQEILYEISVLLKEGSVPGLEKVPVWLDSPLAIRATEIFKKQYRDYFDEEALEYMNEGVNFFGFKTLHIAETAEESKAINEMPDQKIIISSSGMCEAGRIKHHLKHNLWRADSTVVFVGYQAEGTLGRQIVDGEKKVKIFNENIHINADIAKIEGFSGHADRDDLIQWVSQFKTHPRKIFLVHGEEDTILSFEKTLAGLGYDVFVPKLNDSFDTSLGVSAAPAAAVPKKDIRELIRQTLQSISAAVEARIARGDVSKLAPMEEELSDFLEKWNNHKAG